jgi:hypothetical protein
MDTLFLVTLGYWSVAACGIVFAMSRFRRFVERETAHDIVPNGSAGISADGTWPEVAVVMSLRGGDDSLRRTLDGLAAQDYPNYRVRLVVDHPHDEVDPIIRSWLRAHPGAPVSVEYLRAPLPSTTLKCSSVHQVLRELGPEVGIVVLVDADSDPYPKWLRDVVSPFAREDVGGVTGNRWYFPREGGIASWVRFVFTAFSLPSMWMKRHSWGGTLALRAEIARSPEFLNAFAQTPTEEQTCFEYLSKLGLRMHFAPQLIQWNPESVDFAGAETHMFRQLTWSRLFYPNWALLVVGTFAMLAAFGSSVWFAASAIAEGRPLWMLPLALMVLFSAAITSSLLRLHHTLQTHVFALQGRSLPSFDGARILDLLMALPCTLGIFAKAIVRAHFASELQWRGITYRIFSDDTIRMAGYVPWKSPASKRTRIRVRPARPASLDRHVTN